jgi:adenylosuccinate lyase
MDLGPIRALSPLDGRYARRLDDLRALFSEQGLHHHRVLVEIRWLQMLASHPGIEELAPFGTEAQARLEAVIEEFDGTEAARVKAIEATTNHDVKAVEYYLRERLEGYRELSGALPFLHFACTSEDINNLAWALILRRARDEVLLPALDRLIEHLRALAHAEADRPMLSRTHGQTASPTTLGKEMAVFAARLVRQRERLARVPILGKMNGAVGNFNAHLVAYPDVDWPAVGRKFVENLGLEHNPWTTQIEPHDGIGELCHALVGLDCVVLDLCRDLWAYVSLGYFRQRAVAGEVGSSTMPHKVNPIDFENAEGNIGIADSLLGHLATKLPVSRLQRDLSDSTALRNLGVGIAHAVLAWRSCLRGLGRLEVAPEALAADLDAAWEVLAEPIQTVMRRHGVEDAYERLRDLTRGQAVDRGRLREFIEALELPEAAKERLIALSPSTYVGAAGRLAREI